MTIFQVTVGWTLTSTDRTYVPYADGYRAGALQHEVSFPVEWTNHPYPSDDDMLAAVDVTRAQAQAVADKTIRLTLADAVFVATNAPLLVRPMGLVGQVLDALEASGYRGVEAGHYSLSVGDTVTVDGVRLACQRSGWTEIKESFHG